MKTYRIVIEFQTDAMKHQIEEVADAALVQLETLEDDFGKTVKGVKREIVTLPG